MIRELFFQLLQVSVGNRRGLSCIPSGEHWKALLDMAVRQSLVGVCGIGIEKLPVEQRPPRDIALRWAFLVSKIEQRNRWLNRKCAEITDLFAADGFSSCILKGQGIALLYPEPLRRQAGDIDILCWPADAKPGRCCADEVVAYVRSLAEPAEIVYHHSKLELAFERSEDGRVERVPLTGDNGVEIEVHHRMTWFYSPLRNRRMQRWAAGSRKDIETSEKRIRRSDGRVQPPYGSALGLSRGESFFTPGLTTDAVYLLVHIYRHLFDEGVGLRQLLDYYYVLTELSKDGRACDATCKILSGLGMTRFCRAVMYVLHHVFGLDEHRMIIEMDEKEGCFLLDEIMQAGNFGCYDERSRPRAGESLAARFVRRQRRVSRFLVHYPEETICAPLWTMWHRAWRKWKGYL